jgi:Nik-related protein kinase
VPEKAAKLPSAVNVNPLSVSPAYNSPILHVYEKDFSSEVYCGSLWGEFDFLN